MLDKLPTILVLAVLVGLFISLRKHSPSVRMRLWVFAWALIFLHFFVQVFETRAGTIEQIYESIDLAALELSGVVFAISMTGSAERARRRLAMLALLGIPVLFHAVAVTFDWHIHWALVAAVALFFFGGAAHPFAVYKKLTKYHVLWSAAFLITGIWSVSAQYRGNADEPVIAILTITFAMAGILFWKLNPRFSPGVVSVAGGFLAWAAVFPTGALVEQLYPALHVNPELWNVPKFFVAFGLILCQVEEKSRIIEEHSSRQRTENVLLDAFSRVTSRLLTARNPASLCSEMAEAITRVAPFRRAAIFLTSENGAPSLAGSSCYSPEECAALLGAAELANAQGLRERCSQAARIGNNSFLVGAAGNSSGNGNGSHSAELIIPLRSSRGSDLGWLSLCDPRLAPVTNFSDISKVEMLAADLGVTIENTRLHSQLVRSEKLAAIGQLVAGVAHELNNPLTGIIGYTEILSEQVRDETARKRLCKLGQEAQRMKRIVDGLLRFSRQGSLSERVTRLESALRDVVQLRDFHFRKHGIAIELDLAPQLPEVAIGEDELKQVLFNLLNNAVDALDESGEKSIRFFAGVQDERVVIRVEDSGSGFLDLNRAFDPFFTTKPPGKGTGLGLSICYGIVRECGGDIQLANRQPHGAVVTLELPLAQPALQPAV